MKTLSFSVGDVIFRQDDFSDVMYDIQSGSVGIFLDYGTETEKKLAVLGAGEILGEMGMIEACPRSATAVALSDGTVLCEIGEAEFTEFFRSHPDRLIRIMKQLSARIRERTEAYFAACHALYENEETLSKGEEKSEALTQQLEKISKAAPKRKTSHPAARSSFSKFIEEDLAETEGKREVVRVNPIEKLTVRHLSPYEMHANPDDEFSQPEVGPNDRIIQEYIESIRQIRYCDPTADIFEEPVMVHKMKENGYLILNGHHRWMAVLKVGLPKIHVKLVNPPKTS
ncbi:MAG: cyclic nucleotide-binding domain-containing protein [Oscillospiraceae bacterium]|nr:cyclic nucleotide-binding domain-containing protein [Oscillospiraceae bacterium]